jgi:hypothetical protein
VAAQFIPHIAEAIRKQVEEYAIAIEDDPSGIPDQPADGPEPEIIIITPETLAMYSRGGMVEYKEPKPSKQRSLTCTRCRSKKRKCDSLIPCSACVKAQVECSNELVNPLHDDKIKEDDPVNGMGYDPDDSHIVDSFVDTGIAIESENTFMDPSNLECDMMAKSDGDDVESNTALDPDADFGSSQVQNCIKLDETADTVDSIKLAELASTAQTNGETRPVEENGQEESLPKEAPGEEDGNASVFEDPAKDQSDYIDISLYDDMRILVKIDVHVGSIYLRDQFEWPLFSSSAVTPEYFSRILCSELGAGGEFVPMVAHSIREQVVMARLNYAEADTPALWTKRPLRDDMEEDDFQPDLRLLTDEEIQHMLKEQDRNSR